MRIPVIVIYDIGKTNKKRFLFDECYALVSEESFQLAAVQDEDGFSCEDLPALAAWITESFAVLLRDARYTVKAVNFSGYGASLVYLDAKGKVLTPLYNYLKPYPAGLLEQFHAVHGDPLLLSKLTASPALGSLNSGLQLYRIKYEQPSVFDRIKYVLHLPQYLSFLVGGQLCSDITSIGCHTMLWDFAGRDYHAWVYKEGLAGRLCRLVSCTQIAGITDGQVLVGTGLHDSSAALIPYLEVFNEPFTLISTGTWCISMNPFNRQPLTAEELARDCLCYLSYRGQPVKASRLFAGHRHETAVKELAIRYGKPVGYYNTVQFDPALLPMAESPSRDSYELAYHQLMSEIVWDQVASTQLVLNNAPVRRIFVDGGFSQNPVYMQLLAAAFPKVAVYAAVVPQASSLGAALAIHAHWNKRSIPTDVVGLRLVQPFAGYSI